MTCSDTIDSLSQIPKVKCAQVPENSEVGEPMRGVTPPPRGGETEIIPLPPRGGDPLWSRKGGKGTPCCRGRGGEGTPCGRRSDHHRLVQQDFVLDLARNEWILLFL
jgi:hypothetical protein